ncbi:MAG: single-stranded-DNA-specific exonuclease RecJ [Cyanobacteria bacterium]|nr:single-stranded-DNA-specific exonuclease RecJ [Cyanobacteria bacterium CG_2015-16_32_12]NCO78866.1 single-stranded-DNA-specific exonuclease RecJ [Cyanobacteria bacterium CG_2015-22_32_23]NCQ05107.1 single-stranded-DNA-specific exonuclease RecJ [Cyanobacteria bacterium CG_2015-09_32_10]NCQ41098.1 single-stranded-DNA-specific exonuclease RecJ [Cyanobacteria bacterium CG_2015-04_32_10]NCS85788.1 single-stranded-DNA-specific exonuclease RecJ [Cyanobacteria bacterium CG_2015-02_32_10]
MKETKWQISPCDNIPREFFEQVNHITKRNKSDYLAKLLWGRGIRDLEKLREFLDNNSYQPSPASEFGREIKSALIRLKKARDEGEKVAIWGNVYGDAITTTCLLWEGLKPFFPDESQWSYYFPDNLTEFSGLNSHGIDLLKKKGVTLIIVADTGSSNLAEINYAQTLAMDMIIIDHHILPDERPPVVSFLNPLNFADNHPFYTFSGVAIAYKLLEALYQQFPAIFSQPLTDFLDLVVIGLLTEVTELKGDSRYLVKQGIPFLKNTKRIGLETLLKLCQQNGDRPMDISQGIIQRINAISYIHSSTDFAFQLLTTKNSDLGKQLAEKAEKANLNLKELQNEIVKQAEKKIQELDLSTTAVIILTDNRWEKNILASVANIVSKKYTLPTILLSTKDSFNQDNLIIAKGYGSSINNVNLDELIINQRDLLESFIKYSNTIELSLPLENIELFRDSINQQIKSKINWDYLPSIIPIDLMVSVRELGENLWQELSLIEPCCLNNSTPKLLIKNAWFSKPKNVNHSDKYGQKIKYIKTYFTIYDESSKSHGFDGIWWEHYPSEINPDYRYDVVVELDYNAKIKDYYIRIIALKLAVENQVEKKVNLSSSIIDNRCQKSLLINNNSTNILLNKCPLQWVEMTQKYDEAIASQRSLILSYNHHNKNDVEELWKDFLGIIKYLVEKNYIIEIEKLLTRLSISELALECILNAIEDIGIIYEKIDNKIMFKQTKSFFESEVYIKTKNCFEDIINQENLQKTYFYQVPVNILESEMNKKTDYSS